MMKALQWPWGYYYRSWWHYGKQLCLFMPEKNTFILGFLNRTASVICTEKCIGKKKHFSIPFWSKHLSLGSTLEQKCVMGINWDHRWNDAETADMFALRHWWLTILFCKHWLNTTGDWLKILPSVWVLVLVGCPASRAGLKTDSFPLIHQSFWLSINCVDTHFLNHTPQGTIKSQWNTQKLVNTLHTSVFLQL